MSNLINFLTSQEIIVVYIVAAVACLLCFVIYLIDKNYYKRKQRHNTRELNKLVEEVSEIMEEESSSTEPTEIYDTPVLETIVPEEKTEIIMETTAEETTLTEEVVQKPVVEELIEMLEVEEPSVKEESNEIEVIEVEELLYTDPEPNRQEAQEELMRLTEELEKSAQEQKNIDLTAYEEEQEENAIISLEELVKKSKEMYEANEYTQYEDEGNEPISLEDLERRMNKIKEEVTAIETTEEPVITETFDINAIIPEIEPIVEPTTEIAKEPEIIETRQMVLDDFDTIKIPEETKLEPPKPGYQTTKKFERSPIISPIYGIERIETQTELELENTANYEKLDEEIKKTNEFLMTLRELQKNLD